MMDPWEFSIFAYNEWLILCCKLIGKHTFSSQMGIRIRHGKKKQLKVGLPPAIKLDLLQIDVGVSKHRGTPKWMVYNGKPY